MIGAERALSARQRPPFCLPALFLASSLPITDSALTAGAPTQRLAEPALARRRGIRRRRGAPAWAWQRHLVHAESRGDALVRGRGKPAIGDRQLRRPPEQLLMFEQRRSPQLLVRHARRAHRVIGDESGFR